MLDHLTILAILNRGKWIILFTTLTLFGVVRLYLRYATPEYEARSILRIDISDVIRESTGPATSPDLTRDQASTEMEVIKSPEIVSQVVRMLNLQMVMHQRGRLIDSEVWITPFQIQIDSSQFFLFGRTIDLDFDGSGNFTARLGESEPITISGQLGKMVEIGGSRFQVELTSGAKIEQLQNAKYSFRVDELRTAIDLVLSRLNVSTWRGLTMFQLSYRDRIPTRAAIILNTLADVYLQKELSLRQKSYDQTIDYINLLLSQVTTDLDNSEKALRRFEVDRQASSATALRNVDMNAYSQSFSNKQIKQYDIRVLESLRQMVETTLTQDKINKGELISIPVLTSEGEEGFVTTVRQLNDLLSRHYFLLKRNTKESPIVRANEESINIVKAQLLTSIDININKAKSDIQFMTRQSEEAAAKLNTYPGIERELQTVSRPFRINEEMYNMLLTRRYETAIAKAAIVSKSTVVNPAVVPTVPLTPKRDLLNFGSIALGLILSLGYVLAREFLRTTVISRREIEANSPVPVIAEIVRSGGRMRNFELEVLTESKSAIAESFRSLRANLSFVASGLPTNTRTIAISSTVSGEGKSYISTNLCASLTLLKQRVLLVDMDLRKPKLHNTLNVPNDIGASSVLSGQVTLERAIQKTSYQYFDILTAGPTPPNSAELLSSKQYYEMLAQLKESYDYIIMDTSPIGLVTDATPVLQSSDVVLYVIRSNYSRISFLSNLNRLRTDQGIDNMFLVLNYVDKTEQVYGYGYGYGYGNSSYYTETRNKGLLERVRNFLN